MRKLLVGLIVAAAVVAAVPSAHARGFVGASYARTDWSSNVGNVSFDDDDTGWKIFGGFGQKYFGVEVSYVDFGKFSSTPSPGNVSNAELTAWDGFFYGRYPIKFFEVFGKVGFSYWDRNQSATITNPPASAGVDDSGTDFVWGLGVGFNFGKHVGVRLEYEGFEIANDSIDLASLGVVVRF